jgi:hypothetical protein
MMSFNLLMHENKYRNNLSNKLYDTLKSHSKLGNKIKFSPKDRKNSFFTIEFNIPNANLYSIHKSAYCGYGMSINFMKDEIIETAFLGKLYGSADIKTPTIILDVRCGYDSYFVNFKNVEELVLKILTIWNYLSSSSVSINNDEYDYYSLNIV